MGFLEPANVERETVTTFLRRKFGSNLHMNGYPPRLACQQLIRRFANAVLLEPTLAIILHLIATSNLSD